MTADREPQTKAGRDHVRLWAPSDEMEGGAYADFVRSILAIEAEARADAARTLLRDLRYGLNRLGYGEEVARIDAALATAPPPAGITVEDLANVLRELAGVGAGDDSRFDSGDYGLLERPSEFAVRILARLAPQPTADPEP